MKYILVNLKTKSIYQIIYNIIILKILKKLVFFYNLLTISVLVIKYMTKLFIKPISIIYNFYQTYIIIYINPNKRFSHFID